MPARDVIGRNCWLQLLPAESTPKRRIISSAAQKQTKAHRASGLIRVHRTNRTHHLLRVRPLFRKGGAVQSALPKCCHDIGRFTESDGDVRGRFFDCNDVSRENLLPEVSRHHQLRNFALEGSTPSSGTS